uniref:ARAD1D09394p n=1 Tax=Blastobotrys adeninivorans TaxID=409370 RepID=A0A060T8R5_BLAAD
MSETEDLSTQVTALSTKLIEAIDRQADLEDQVQVLKKELESTRKDRLALEDKLADSNLVEKSALDLEISKRESAERESSRLQGEIEELTGSLFDEANRMVADAKKETAYILKKNSHLEARLAEKDALLESLNQQLDGLKEVLQDMTDEKAVDGTPRTPGINSSSSNSSTAMFAAAAMTGSSATGASSSIISNSTELSRGDDVTSTPQGTEGTAGLEGPDTPRENDHAYSVALFSSIRPIVRRDLTAFTEFKSMTSHHKFILQIHSSLHPNSSTNGEVPVQGPSLKDFRFFKRVLNDDIEPTLRLDQSPTLSWLARRSVMSAILDGTAVVEPISGVNESFKFIGNELLNHEASVNGSGNMYPTGNTPVATRSPCKLCGESRSDSLLHARMHNLRVGRTGRSNGGVGSESPSFFSSLASRETLSPISSDKDSEGQGASTEDGSVVSTGYPLCYYCVNRVRTVCDFVTFMRAVRDGLWKADDDVGRARAWDECCRLRERMFWARIGGAFPLQPVLSTPGGFHSSMNSRRTEELAARAENLNLRFAKLEMERGKDRERDSDDEFEDSQEQLTHTETNATSESNVTAETAENPETEVATEATAPTDHEAQVKLEPEDDPVDSIADHSATQESAEDTQQGHNADASSQKSKDPHDSDIEEVSVRKVDGG